MWKSDYVQKHLKHKRPMNLHLTHFCMKDNKKMCTDNNNITSTHKSVQRFGGGNAHARQVFVTVLMFYVLLVFVWKCTPYDRPCFVGMAVLVLLFTVVGINFKIAHSEFQGLLKKTHGYTFVCMRKSDGDEQRVIKLGGFFGESER